MSHAKLNVLAMLAMPLCATLAALLAFGMLGDTLFTVFSMNLAPMLLGAGIAAVLLLLARPGGSRARWVALLPCLVPALIGSIWYLWRALMPNPVAPGVEYIAAPTYLLLWVLALSVPALIGVLLLRRSDGG